MKHKNSLAIATLGLLLFYGVIVNSQESKDSKLEICTKLNSKNEAEIFDGYELLVNNDGLVKPEYRDDVKIRESLWSALKYLVPEPTIVKAPESETNNTADYLLYIIGDVQETRAIPYLLKNIHVRGFRDSLARMGDVAIIPAFQLLETGNETEKQYAIEILREMVVPKPRQIEVGYIDPVKGPSNRTITNTSYGLYVATGKTRAKIKEALKTQLDAKSVKIKKSALTAYKYVADAEDVKMLNDIAQNDSHKIRGTRVNNREKYPLREEAQKALAYIRANRKDAQTTIITSTITK